MSLHISDDILALFQDSEKFLLASHVNPDADAYGSMCGLALALQATGKQVDCFNVNGFVSRYEFIPGADRVESTFDLGKKYDLIVICDCGDRKRVGDGVYAQFEESGCPIVNIDHHISNDGFGTHAILSVAHASTSEIICSLLKLLNIEPGADAAQSLLAGIVGDTGSFRYPNTTSSTFEFAADLVKAGARPSDIAAGMYTFPFSAIKLQAEALLNMQTHLDGRVAEVIVTEEMFQKHGSSAEYTELLVERARDIDGVQAAFFIRSEGEYWKVSLRSQPGGWNVSALATEFGGGGHVNAAGFRFRGELSELRSRLISYFKTHEA